MRMTPYYIPEYKKITSQDLSILDILRLKLYTKIQKYALKNNKLDLYVKYTNKHFNLFFKSKFITMKNTLENVSKGLMFYEFKGLSHRHTQLMMDYGKDTPKDQALKELYKKNLLDSTLYYFTFNSPMDISNNKNCDSSTFKNNYKYNLLMNNYNYRTYNNQ